jgi:Xaa-Pro aminopeptidase
MIFGRHSVLKRGCSTWDAQQMPKSEFEARLDRVRSEMAQLGLDVLVIYGDNYSFGDICYLTNYFPKVRGGLALVPRDGTPALLLNIGSRDVPFAKTLTWVDDVRASNQVGIDGAKLLKEKGFENARLGLVDSGRGFPLPQLEEMKKALPDANWKSMDTMCQSARLTKTTREITAMSAAGRLLHDICEGAAAFIKPGRKEFEIIADIDRCARDLGAEDLRILAGAKRLNPPSFKQAAQVNSHWAVYFAVQHERYWAEVGRTYILADDAELQRAYERAQKSLSALAKQLKPNRSTAQIEDIARRELGEFYPAAAVYGIANGIGLNLWEAPFLNEEDAHEVGAPSVGTTQLDENMVLALRVVIESAGKIVICGDTFQVTTPGAKSLVGIAVNR